MTDPRTYFAGICLCGAAGTFIFGDRKYLVGGLWMFAAGILLALSA